MTSPYLNRPLRTREQAEADIAGRGIILCMVCGHVGCRGQCRSRATDRRRQITTIGRHWRPGHVLPDPVHTRPPVKCRNPLARWALAVGAAVVLGAMLVHFAAGLFAGMMLWAIAGLLYWREW